jgi:MSHA biogenesis protein MshI
MDIAMNTKGWTSIDCSDAASLCAVSLRTAVRAGDRPQVLAAAEEMREQSDTEGAELHALMRRVDGRLPVLVTLPRAHYRLRVMPEPAVPQREMLSSLRWSLGTEGDGLAEDLNIAWMRIPTDEQLPSRPRQIYAVTTPTTGLTTRLASWRQAGVKPKVVDIRETALRNIAGALERAGEGLALVSADAGGIGMVFTHQGSLYLDRYIDQPMASLGTADAESRVRVYERIAVQLQRSIDVVGRNFPFMPIARVVVAPAPAAPGLHEFLATQFTIPVEALDLNQLFDLTRVPALAQSPALQARCLVPLGAALRSAKGATA